MFSRRLYGMAFVVAISGYVIALSGQAGREIITITPFDPGSLETRGSLAGASVN
jgi:hypothetical protein